MLLSMKEVSSSLTSLAQDGVERSASLLIAFKTSEMLETGSSSTNGVDEGGDEGRSGGDGSGAAAGSAAVAVAATDAGVLHLGVGVERAVGGGVAAGSTAVELAATDAGVLHLGVGVERAVAAKAIRMMSLEVANSLFMVGGGDGVMLPAVAVAASALAAEEQVQASPKRRCSKRVDSVWMCSWERSRLMRSDCEAITSSSCSIFLAWNSNRL